MIIRNNLLPSSVDTLATRKTKNNQEDIPNKIAKPEKIYQRQPGRLPNIPRVFTLYFQNSARRGKNVISPLETSHNQPREKLHVYRGARVLASMRNQIALDFGRKVQLSLSFESISPDSLHTAYIYVKVGEPRCVWQRWSISPAWKWIMRELVCQDTRFTI